MQPLRARWQRCFLHVWVSSQVWGLTNELIIPGHLTEGYNLSEIQKLLAIMERSANRKCHLESTKSESRIGACCQVPASVQGEIDSGSRSQISVFVLNQQVLLSTFCVAST